MISRHLISSATLAAVVFAAPASADTLRAGGIGASAAMLPPLFAAFDPKGEHKLEVVPALGSSGALRAAADGMLDLAMSGRALKDEEIAQGMTQALAVRTPFLLVSSRATPGGKEGSEISEIYLAPRATWSDGSPVRIILRPLSDSDTPVLRGMFPNMVPALEAAHKRRDVPVAATDQDNADLAEKMPGSLATSTLTQVQMEQRRLHAIAIGGIEPTLSNLERGTYPYAKTLLFVLPARKSALAERFIAFLKTSEGRAALAATGNLSVGATS
jgi:phosphate transport system substrate-binding protein